MWLPKIVLLLSVTCTTASVVDEESKAIVGSVFAPDLFHRFLLSYPPNSSISPCENLYRHFCPNDLPKRHQFSTILKGQVEILRKLQQLNMQDDIDYVQHMEVLSEKLADNKTFNASVISAEIYEHCFHHGGRTCIVDMIEKLVPPLFRRYTDTIFEPSPNFADVEKAYGLYQKLRHGNLSPKVLVNIAAAVIQLYQADDVFPKKMGQFLMNAPGRLAFLSFLEKGGLMNEQFANELDEISKEVRGELAEDALRYSWSREESRFGVQTGTLFHLHMTRAVKDYLPLDRHDMQLEEIRRTAMHLVQQVYDSEQIVGTPNKRANVVAAVLQAIYSLPNEVLRRIRIFDEHNAYASPRHLVVFSHLLLLRLLHNVPSAAKYGGFYASYAHELQHQLQFVSQNLVEHAAFYDNRNACISSFARDLCHPSMFLEKRCNSGHVTFKEDDADIVGQKITLRLFQRHNREQLKEKPYADVNLTNEELFFAARVIMSCEEYENSQHRILVGRDGKRKWNEHSGASFRANAINIGTTEFRKIFRCPANSKMTHPNPFFLEKNNEGKYPEVDNDLCDPNSSGYSYVQ